MESKGKNVGLLSLNKLGELHDLTYTKVYKYEWSLLILTPWKKRLVDVDHYGIGLLAMELNLSPTV